MPAKERIELTLGKAAEHPDVSPVDSAHTYLFTPIHGPLSILIGRDVILSEVEDLEGGQSINVLGVYSPQSESVSAYYNGPIKYSLRPIPINLAGDVAHFVSTSESKRTKLIRLD